jgi:hypothetical protein
VELRNLQSKIIGFTDSAADFLKEFGLPEGIEGEASIKFRGFPAIIQNGIHTSLGNSYAHMRPSNLPKKDRYIVIGIKGALAEKAISKAMSDNEEFLQEASELNLNDGLHDPNIPSKKIFIELD